MFWLDRVPASQSERPPAESVGANPIRMAFGFAAILVVALMLAAMTGCSGPDDVRSGNGEGAASDAGAVRIGTMPTEDFLPMWVAKEAGLFVEEGLDVQLESFDSAPALSAALAAGELDMAMVDVMRAAKLCESGTPVAMEWVTLGEESDQGEFGVVAPADAEYSDLRELASWLEQNPDAQGVGVAANTVPEYVFDMLCEEEGVDPSKMRTVEIASLPERYALVANGNLAAASLPNSLLVLGQQSGLKVLATDAQGDNLSQSVMIATQSFASDDEAALEKVANVWNVACDMINSDPAAYRSVLADHANLNDAIVEAYPLSTYPLAIKDGDLDRPSAEYVDSVLSWMRDKGYSSMDLAYDPEAGTIIVG